MRKILNKLLQYSNRTYLSHWIVLGIDTFISLVCSLYAYIGLHYITDTHYANPELLLIACTAVLTTVVGSVLFGTYRNTIRYSSAGELSRVIYNVIFQTLGMAVVIFSFSEIGFQTGQLNMAYLLFDGISTLIGMICFRVFMIVVYESLIGISQKKAERILIYGLDDKSVALRTRLRNSSRYKIIGFYTSSSGYSLRNFSGYPVFHAEDEEDFCRLVAKKRIRAVLFSKHEDTRSEQDKLVTYCKNCRVKALMAPTISEADEHGKFHQFVRPIKIEDLLGREEININMEKVLAEFQHKVVLVTGAAGSIGSELCRQLAQLGVRKLVLFDSAETPLHNIRLELEENYPQLDFVPVIGDVRVKKRVRKTFEKHRPQIVLHAAAYKHVPLMEENPCEAALVNITGSRQVADMSVEFNVEKFIMVSTDKAVNPTNVMGASKRLAEIYTQSLGYALKEGVVKGSTKFITTRFGNVLGSNGSVIPRFKKQIEDGGPVTVTHPDIIRYFMTIPEACRLVLEAGTMGEGNEIFVFEMGEPVKIVDLAKRMIELAGYTPGEHIKIEFTGLRPGEKLFEEMLNDEENTLPTSNSKIRVADTRRYAYEEILKDYDKFEQLARSVEIVDTVRLMKELVPEFVSKNSRFEELDKDNEPAESVSQSEALR